MNNNPQYFPTQYIIRPPQMSQMQQIPQQQIMMMQEPPYVQCFFPVMPTPTIQPFFYSSQPPVHSAAPLPKMPSKTMVNGQRKSVMQELNDLKAELSSLERMQQGPNSRVLTVRDSSVKGIVEYHNFIINNNLVNDIIADNVRRKKKSEAHMLCQCGSTYSQIQDLPDYKKKNQEYVNLMTPLFFAHMHNALLVQEKQMALAQKYIEIKNRWENGAKAIDEYSIRMDGCHEKWPPEFPKEKTKSDKEEEVRKYTAPDQPQIMTRLRRETMCLFNMNGYVEDPEAAHKEYKNRISWSEEEKQTFVEKYIQRPKKFAFIAQSLPLKSVKDVIEFYYINRYDLNLKEKEGILRKRGGRRKVTSEGRSSYPNK